MSINVPVELRKALEKFNTEFPRPHMPGLQVEGSYDLDEDWPDVRFPNASDAGVYVITDSGYRILRIDKASMNNNLGFRLASHFKYATDRSKWEPVYPEVWKPHGWPKYIFTIPVPKERSFEAPAVEEFLIQYLEPPTNVQGRRS